MQAPVHVYFYPYIPRPPPPPSQPGYGFSAVHRTLTHNGLPGLISRTRGRHEPQSGVPVFMAASAARSWLAECKDSQQVADGIQHYAPLLRVQGWTLLIADCGRRGGMHSCSALSAFRSIPVLYLSHPSCDRHPNSTCHVWLHPPLQSTKRRKQFLKQSPTRTYGTTRPSSGHWALAASGKRQWHSCSTLSSWHPLSGHCGPTRSLTQLPLPPVHVGTCWMLHWSCLQRCRPQVCC